MAETLGGIALFLDVDSNFESKPRDKATSTIYHNFRGKIKY